MAGKSLPPLGPLTQAKLREILHYDPATGVFTWTGARQPHRAGMVAGGIGNEGYGRVFIEGRFYPASRLAWVYMTGDWPPIQVDHINRNTSDNRFSNLRLATQTENKANSGVYKNNKLGMKGIRRHRNGRYEARIRVEGKLVYLGCRKTIEEAAEVYKQAAKLYFGEFARTE